MHASPDTATDGFAGELFLTLATEGRLVVDARQADELIAGLQRALCSVETRLRLAEQCPEKAGGESQELVDAVFMEQIAPGHLRRAADQIPKYIESLRRARRERPLEIS